MHVAGRAEFIPDYIFIFNPSNPAPLRGADKLATVNQRLGYRYGNGPCGVVVNPLLVALYIQFVNASWKTILWIGMGPISITPQESSLLSEADMQRLQ